MDLWEKGDCIALVEDTDKTDKMQQPNVQWRESLEHVRHVYTLILLWDNLCQAVHWITGRDKGGLLQPTDVNSKTGKPVSEVLLSKHPAQSQPPEAALEEYDTLPALIDINVMEDVVHSIASKI
eukprot:3321436-Ditylum_brightwellii.AAC.1